MRASVSALTLACLFLALSIIATPAQAVTVVPDGTFVAIGPATFDASIFGTVTCQLELYATVLADGTGAFNAYLTGCSDPLFTACTASVTTNPAQFSITSGLGTYRVTSAEVATMNDAPGGFTCGVDCTFQSAADKLIGTINTTIDDVADGTPQVRLTGPLTSGTPNCNNTTVTYVGKVTLINGSPPGTLQIKT